MDKGTSGPRLGAPYGFHRDGREFAGVGESAIFKGTIPNVEDAARRATILEKVEGAPQYVWAAREIIMAQVDPMTAPGAPEPFRLVGYLLGERLDDGGRSVAELHELTRTGGYFYAVSQKLEFNKELRPDYVRSAHVGFGCVLVGGVVVRRRLFRFTCVL